jgi:DNA polymerase I-like protein with 3'-5' exonuclease and polymerase domains
LQYKYVTSAQDLGEIAQEIAESESIGLDIETTDLDPRQGKVRLVQLKTERGWHVIDVFKTGTLGAVAEALSNDTGETGPGRPVIIGQNLKFEQKWLLHHFGIRLWPIFDTYRASNVLHNGRNKRHDLNSIYRRELNIDSSLKKAKLGASDWSGRLSQEQLDYAAEDVLYLHRLRKVLKDKLKRKKLNRTALIEFQAVLPESVIETNGFFLNQEQWLTLAEKNRIEASERRLNLLSALPHPEGQLGLFGASTFNLDSPEQVLRSLARRGIKLEDSKRTTMAMVAAEHPIIQDIIAYREVAKRFSSFGPKYLKHIHPITARIHTSFYPYTGAGRYACLVAGSQVRTPDGSCAIEKLRPGALVWTHRSRWRRVLAHLPKGEREVFRVRLGNGEVLTCTGSHRFLSSDGEWLHTEDLYREHFKNVDAGCEEHRSSAGSLQKSEAADTAAGGGGVGHDLSQCSARGQGGDAGGREEGAAGASVFCDEEGIAKSELGEDGGGASELERGVRGRVRVSDVPAQREATICASGGDGGSSRLGGVTGDFGCASHRWGQDEQCARQSRVGNKEGTQVPTLYAGEGQPVVTIEKIYPCGSAAVYDIAVEEDESYQCAGVFSHNSSKPNLQQIPRTKDFRSCFQAEPGYVLIFADYSQIELRLAAEVSQDPMLLKIFREGLDPHIMTASLISGIPYDKITPAQRQLGKPINFGLIYGLMPKKLVIYAQSNYGVAMTEREAQKFWDAYFESYPRMRRWQEERWAVDKPRQQSRTIVGRLRYLESDTAHNEFLNTPIQGSGADGLKIALAVVERRLRKYGDDVRMIHMVHDEIGLECRRDTDLIEEVKNDLEQGMIEGMQQILTSVPVEADAAFGRTWAAAK